MNDTLQNTVNEVLQGAISQATKGAEFLKEQIPDILQQLLAWKLAEASIKTAVGLVGIALTVWAGKHLWRWVRKEDSGYEPMMVFLGLPLVPSFILASNFFDAVKILVAPKVWLLEYAAELVRYAR
jgi:hypothetical protein